MRTIPRTQALKLVALVTVGVLAACGWVRSAPQQSAEPAYLQGNGWLDQARFREAVAAYDRCLAADPHYAPAYFNRALANEMVDRARALADWKRFVEVADDDSRFKWQVGQARAQGQILASLPALPATLQPAQYVESSGDYYPRIALNSAGALWESFPVRFFLGSAPELQWQQGAREAFDIWSKFFPLRLVAEPDRADIRMGWEESVEAAGEAGVETDWVRFRQAGSGLNSRRIAIITVDLSRRWSKDEMRAIVLHELGHALGIKEHSDSARDIMYWQMQEKVHQVMLPYPVFWKSLVKQPSARDLNTLIRLYNSGGYIARLP